MFLHQLLAALARGGANRPRPTRGTGPVAEIAPAPGTAGYSAGLVRERSAQAILDAAERGEDMDPLEAFLGLPSAEQFKLVEAGLATLPDNEKRLMMGVLRQLLDKAFIPTPGPQTQALMSEADVLLYGGAAGGGKSFLSIGCAATEHRRALIVRRQSVELDGLVKDSQDMLRGRGKFNGTDKEWSLDDGRSLRFGGIKEPDEWRKYAGQARDFMAFDEAAEFLEGQVASLLGWLRTTVPGQRCRAILASNPPRGAEGQWVIRWFAPWLEKTFPNPAAPGELRWCIQLGDETRWVDGPEPVIIGSETYTPLSRTFIPARLDDNPYLARTNYRAGLQNLPEPLRSQLLKGDFMAGRRDDAWQVIPSEWIQAAQERWTPQPPPGSKMTSVGVDLAYGGSDSSTIAARRGSWFAPIRELKSSEVDTKDASLMFAYVLREARDGCEIVVDVGGGYASGLIERFKDEERAITGFNGSEASMLRSAEGMSFANRRAEVWWKFREALNPDGGAWIALPPDPQLVGDLSTPRWKPVKGGIQIEAKEEIRKRLGRSPDKGDAVVMAWAHGDYRQALREERISRPQVNLGHAQAKQHYVGQRPSVNLGHAHAKRRF